MPEQRSFLPARKGGPPALVREHDVYLYAAMDSYIMWDNCAKLTSN
jgi:hypothetical protein